VVAGRHVHLKPPINWSMDPFHSDPWRKKLTTLTWLSPLLRGYGHLGDKRALVKARDVALDWVRKHHAPSVGTTITWERKRVSDRAGVLAYVTRAAACEDRLGHHQARLLLASARTHGNYLYRSSSDPNNHALLAASGLVVLSEAFPFLHDAHAWRKRGISRFTRTVHKVVDKHTGVHLEHSPGYQERTNDHVKVFLSLFRHPPQRLVGLLRRMRHVTGWFVMPDKTIVPIGDTHSIVKSPGYALPPTLRQGLSTIRRDGYSIVKHGGSFLAAVAGYHHASHKHADELSFDLFEDGRRVIVETGRRNKSQNANNPASVRASRFTMTSQAHSTLTADGHSFDLNHRFYGSAIDAQGRDPASGWFAIEGHNPLIASQGVNHHRLYLYRPGEALVVCDFVRSGRRHTYDRWLQVAPGIHVKRHGAEARLSAGDGFRATVWSDHHPQDLRTKLFRGHRHPLRGWWEPPRYGKLRPRYALDLRTRARNADRVFTLGLSAQPVKASVLSHHHGASTVRVELPGQTPVAVSVRRDHHELVVSQSQP
jgi:hypothetical protein